MNYYHPYSDPLGPISRIYFSLKNTLLIFAVNLPLSYYDSFIPCCIHSPMKATNLSICHSNIFFTDVFSVILVIDGTITVGDWYVLRYSQVVVL